MTKSSHVSFTTQIYYESESKVLQYFGYGRHNSVALDGHDGNKPLLYCKMPSLTENFEIGFYGLDGCLGFMAYQPL